MADKKISALTAATTPLAGTEVLPIVQSGTTNKVSVADLTAGRDTSVAKLTATDNIVIATAGKGVDFSATTNVAGMTSELFSDYEEGTWTPVIEGTTTAGTGTYTVQSGRYTKIGNRVFFDCNVVWSAHTGTGNMYLAGFPFVPALVFRAIPAVTWDITQTGGKAPCIVFGSGSFLKANIAEYGNSGAYANIAMDTSGQILVNGSYEI